MTNCLADSGFGRMYRSDGTELRLSGKRNVAMSTANSEEPLGATAGAILGLAWTADGQGVWIVERSFADGRGIVVRRMPLGSRSDVVSTIVDPARDDSASRLQGHLMLLLGEAGITRSESPRISRFDHLPGWR